MQQQEQLLMPSGKIPHIGKVAQLISTRKANRVLFAELLGLLHPAAYCLEAYPQQLLQPLFLLLQHQTQQRIEQDTLRREVKEAAQRISRESFRCHVQPELVAAPLIRVALAADDLLVAVLRDFAGVSLPSLPPLAGVLTGRVTAQEVLQEAVQSSLQGSNSETFLDPTEHAAVKAAPKEAPEEAPTASPLELKGISVAKAGAAKGKTGRTPKAASKEAVELTVPSNAPEAPKDRNRRVLTGCWSTPAVMAAVRQYTASCAAATAEVRKQIESLSASLQPLLPAIIQAAHLTSILQAAGHHAAFACSNGWNLPELRNDGGMALQVRDLTPYYLPRSNLSSTGSSSSSNASLATDSVDTQSALEPLHASRGASSVSFDLNGLFLLTGENMAGKSTLCRSTLALTLLANAGLFCPCGSGTKVPRYSAFLSSSCIAHDSPLENKSFFVFESQQLKAVLQQTLDSTSPHGNPAGAVGCPKEELSETHAEGENKATAERGSSTTANTHGVTPSNSKTAEQGEARKSIGEAGRFARSFLILDEPCKGTAPNCGAALLGSVLESLADVRAQGIISTHLHQQLSALPLSLPPAAVSFKQMKICRRQKASGKTEHKKRPLKQEEDAAPKNAAEEHDAAWLDNTSDCDLFANEDEWDYELADGICSDSNALHAAEKAGIPQTVLQRAKALRRYFHPDAEHTEEQAARQRLAQRPGERSKRGKQQASSSAAAVAVDAASGVWGDASAAPQGSLSPVVHERATSALHVQRKLESLRELLIDVYSNNCRSSSMSPQVLLLPPFPQQLDPPPAWASSACVYVLVALERTTAALIGECHAQHIGADAARRLDSVSSQQAALARFEQFETPGEIAARAREGPPKTPTTPPLFGSYRVYVGESERVCERLKRHRAASQWSSALALVLRTPGKSEARKIETETIRRLIGDSEIRLMSIKDGNRR
ncbi:MUTS domain-containing protein [Cyclospora cayetanensis]|uniref:MUTS domain-containing protein n=1 Tax=Cyclospora cayetanensis TaxID=88456 RepID=A0A1D3CUK3_9EIME|nr:MUTS domain-containing protein [Cyclospora cayetanensis]